MKNISTFYDASDFTPFPFLAQPGKRGIKRSTSVFFFIY